MSDESPRRSRRLAKEPSEYEPLSRPKRRRFGGGGTPGQPSTLSTPSTSDWPQLAAKAKETIDGYRPIVGKEDKNLKECLHAFVNHLPFGGRESIARDIIDCGDDDRKLFLVFDSLRTSLLAPVQALSSKGSISSSPHSERQDQVDHIAENIPGPSSRSKSWRNICLKRDDFRCVFSQHLGSERWEQLGKPENEIHLPVEVAHIIPFSFASYKDKDAPPKPVTEMWTTLYRCFPEVRRIGMNSDRINDSSNAITMASPLHAEFGIFNMALVPTNTERLYHVKTYHGFSQPFQSLLPADGVVRLRCAEEGEDIRLPDPSFLQLHYIMAEILNASGMGSVLGRQLRDTEDIDCLREDGSTPIGLFLATVPWGLVT